MGLGKRRHCHYCWQMGNEPRRRVQPVIVGSGWTEMQKVLPACPRGHDSQKNERVRKGPIHQAAKELLLVTRPRAPSPSDSAPQLLPCRRTCAGFISFEAA